MSVGKESTTEMLRTLLDDYKLRYPNLDLPTISLQIIHSLTTELQRLQNVITNLQTRLRCKSRRAFIKFENSAILCTKQHIDTAFSHTQHHLHRRDYSTHVSCSVTDVSLKNSDETFKFSSGNLNFSDEKFYETVTESTGCTHQSVPRKAFPS